MKARSMRDNLIFYNIPEYERENTTTIIHESLEDKMKCKMQKLKSRLTGPTD